MSTRIAIFQRIVYNKIPPKRTKPLCISFIPIIPSWVSGCGPSVRQDRRPTGSGLSNWTTRPVLASPFPGLYRMTIQLPLNRILLLPDRGSTVTGLLKLANMVRNLQANESTEVTCDEATTDDPTGDVCNPDAPALGETVIRSAPGHNDSIDDHDGQAAGGPERRKGARG